MTLRRRDFLVAGGGAAAAMAIAATAQAQTAPAQSVTDLAAYQALDREERISVINLREIEAEAAKILPAESHAFISSGSGDEWTMRQNEASFDDWIIEPDYLSGTPRQPDTSATLLGNRLTLPVITAPMGGHGRAHARKELPTIEGTNAFGTLYTSTTVSNLSLEEIAAAGTGAKWFQIYFPQDRGFAREQLQRAKAAGYTAIIITIDSTTFSNRERPIRLGISAPDLGVGNVPQTPGIDASAARVMKADLDWADVEFCATETGLPVLVKGVLTPKLAAECVTRGVAGVWVSNHGGRGIDRLAPAITALPRIADAVAGAVPIVIDSGFRRGQDVFTALALGADAVALGRPILYGLALGGSQGVQAVYNRLRTELQMVMQLAGTATVSAIRPDHVRLLREL
ncbi:MAG: alpha-hydroxy-acid oxidizing protein [Rhizobiaceae bacterium]|nr:alpha-hydroxy-acid oxidizing protein [Rhizobiaceae bacterium]